MVFFDNPMLNCCLLELADSGDSPARFPRDGIGARGTNIRRRPNQENLAEFITCCHALGDSVLAIRRESLINTAT